MSYFKRSKSELLRNILEALLVSGAIAVASTSPYFLINLWRNYRRWKKYPRKKFHDTFSYLRRRGYLETKNEHGQIYISLTAAGKRKANRFQIDDLKLEKSVKWDGRWRIIFFDVVELKKIHREALRGKLKELGFCLLQKSVWVVPWPCEKEIELLREFFGLSASDLRLVVSSKIGPDENLRRFFKV